LTTCRRVAAFCLLLSAFCYAQTSQTPKLTAKTTKHFVHALGACADGELGFDSTNKLMSCEAAVWKRVLISGVTGITSLNGLTATTQTFAVDANSPVGWTSSGSAHTLNMPDASATVRGLWTTGTQTFTGAKTFDTNSTATFNGILEVPDKSSNPSAIAGRVYHHSTNDRLRSSDGVSWFEYATVSAAQTFTGLQTFTDGVDGSGASAGVRHRFYNQCARPTLGTGETAFWFRTVTPTCTGTGNGHGGLLHFDGGNYWWWHGASGGGTVVADVCNGASCDS
jgi:hypothetical protein